MKLLLCSIVMQSIQIYYGGRVMFVVTCFLVIMVKNGCSVLDHGTLKSAIYIYIYIYQKLINEMRWTFPCWYKFRKDKYWVNNYWVGMLKNVRDLLDHGTLKSGVSHKWCDEPSWLNEWFLHADSDWIIFGLTTNLLYIFDICCSCTC